MRQIHPRPTLHKKLVLGDIFMGKMGLSGLEKLSDEIKKSFSLIMDFLVRKKVSLNLTYTILDSLPFPRSVESGGPTHEIVKRALRLMCAGPEMTDFFRHTAVLLYVSPDAEEPAFNPQDRERLRAEIEVLVARDLFGLTRDEMRYVLDPTDLYGTECLTETFRVLKNNEMKEFGEYRTQLLVLEAWDRLIAVKSC